MQTPSDNLFEYAEQFYLRRVQLANWGTFGGIHSVDLSPKGHLFVGGSGSGKSTLLDAVSVLLTPGRINFNAAARPGEKRSDRSFMSYIRGAWSSEQDSDGRAASRFLRTGSTWSAVAATFRSNLDRTVTLLFIGYVKGVSREEQSVVRNYAVVPGPFEMTDIADFASSDFNVKLIRKRYPESRVFQSFGLYFDCFAPYFGLTDQKVLQLLHKTQSAKNMGDINAFFREFMLEVPKTFEIARTLVEEFGELNQAYEVVKKARAQVAVLKKAQTAHEERRKASEEVREIAGLAERTELWKDLRLSGFLSARLPKAEEEAKAAARRCAAVEDKEKETLSALEDLRAEHYRSGGDVIERLEVQKKSIAAELAGIERQRGRLENELKGLQETLPTDAEGFEALIDTLKNERDALTASIAEEQVRRDEAHAAYARRQENFAELCREIEAMKRQPSNIPAKQIKLRDELAAELGLESADLPFAGELIQILDEEARWQGACERVLRPLTLSILVSDRDYARFARAVNARSLGERLVYNRMTRRRGGAEAPDPDSVPTKFEIKEGPHRVWLLEELAARFNYVCVEDTAQFAAHEKAVTLSGQIKHTDVRHEKDDRFRLGDRSRWVTGFGNAEKRLWYEAQAAELAGKIESDRRAIRAFDEKIAALRGRSEAIRRVFDYEWKEVDTATPAAALNRIETELEARRRDSAKLQDLGVRIKALEQKYVTLKDERDRAAKAQWSADQKLSKLRTDLEAVRGRLAGKTPEAELMMRLDGIDRERTRTELTAENVEQRAAGLATHLEKTAGELRVREERFKGEMLEAFREFKTFWPLEAGAMDVSDAAAEDYLHLLEKLETDGLPQYEERFRELLENHAKQNLIDLAHELENERRQIKARMKEVNDSLAEVAFNRSEKGETHLRIGITDKRLAEVTEFRQMQADIMREGVDTRGAAAAERYFAKLSDLVARLNPDNPQNKLWRERVLDVRGHVTFQGVEYDDENRTVEFFASGAGKSGGQQQKLTMTCMVAALRYQLGGTRASKPKFAPVMMDEAFDKADSEFTDISMRIFSDFGFQPVIATPEKGLYTLEPYMGSFSYISCRDRKESSILSMTPEVIGGMLHEKDRTREGTAEGGR